MGIPQDDKLRREIETGAPSFSFSVEAGDKLSIADTLDNRDGLIFRLSREHNNSDGPCILRWTVSEDGFTSSGPILLHHATNGEVKELSIDKDNINHSNTTTYPFVVTQLGGGWVHEVQPGTSISLTGTLPKVYREQLIPGERYELLWPGQEIGLWDWGDVRQHLGSELTPREPKIETPSGRQRLGLGLASHPHEAPDGKMLRGID